MTIFHETWCAYVYTILTYDCTEEPQEFPVVNEYKLILSSLEVDHLCL